MKNTGKRILNDITPPILKRFVLKLIQLSKNESNFIYGSEQSKEFYDNTFIQSIHWKKHYTESHYYPLWTVIADRIRRAKPKRILDIGCGPGQVACLLRDIGIQEYIGLDFSRKRIEQAQTVCNDFDFVVADVFKDKLLETDNYDFVLIMEFLEHVEKDIEVLKRIRPGTKVLATIPNYPSAAHVRYFKSTADVKERYNAVLKNLQITSLLARIDGTTYYILQGER